MALVKGVKPINRNTGALTLDYGNPGKTHYSDAVGTNPTQSVMEQWYRTMKLKHKTIEFHK